MIRKSLLIPFLLGILSGCVSETVALNEYERKLDWVKAADPQADAHAAVARGDLRLMALPGRGQVIPGVDVEERSEYAKKCGIRLTPGVTDAVQGTKHLEMLKQARDYAEQYNAVIMANCRP